MAAIIAGVVLAILFWMTFARALQVGISNDQPAHVSRMDSWFGTGWYLPEQFFAADGSIDDTIEPGRIHAYGPAYSLFGHLVAVVAGAEAIGEVVHSPEAYAARGLAVAILGAAAAAAVGYASWVLSRSRLVAVWSTAAVMAMPLWAGYSMFAVKDVPAGAGWSMFTAGLVVAAHDAGRRSAQMAGLLCLAGVWFSFGVRTALWVPLALTLGVAAGLVWPRWRILRPALYGSGLAFLAVAVVEHRSAATPLQWLVGSVRTSADFDWTGATLTAGQLVMEKPPWWYLPAWVTASVPILLGVLAVAGAVWAIARFRRDATVLWLVQAVMLPTAATVTGATMYGGLRQHLYVLPALAALSGLAIWRLTQLRWRYVTATLAVVALVLPAIDAVRLHPYAFVYKNVLAGQVDERWETDMHWVSAREAYDQVPEGARVRCYKESVVRPSGETRDPWPYSRCSHQVTSWRDRSDGVGELWVIGRRYRGSPPAARCEDAGSVTRPLRGQTVTLSWVLRCPDRG